MQCTRCKSIVADTAPVCPTCGNALGAVDSYGVTSFAPVLPPPQPAAHVSVRAPSQQPVEQIGVASTMMSSSVASPPTLASNAPPSPYGGATSPRYVVTPAQPQPPIQPAPPTMQSGLPGAIQPSNAIPNNAMMAPYGPPQPPVVYSQPYSQPYGMMMQPPMAEPTPGLAVAALICGLLGWIPFWIGFILCLLAITFGGIVIANTRPGQAGRGLAITGLVFGLVLLLPAACGL